MTVNLLPISEIPDAVFKTIVAETVNRILQGRANNVGTVTLTDNAASTTVSDNKFESGMVPVLVPTTANASAEIGAGTIYVSARAQGSFTLTHANNAQTDRTFLYLYWG